MKHTFAKRITSLLLTVAMLCSFAPTAFAADDPLPDSGTAVTAENTGGAEDGAAANSASGEPSADNLDEDPVSNDHEIPTDTDAESVQLNAQVYDVQPDTETPALFATAKATYYVANYDAGGSDGAGDGSIVNPYMTINKAITSAKAVDAESLEIVLLSDISSTLEIVFDDPDMPILFTSDGGRHTLQYTGTAPIGASSGFLKVIAGAQVSFDNVTLAGSTGAYDARVLYVAEGAEVTLADTTVTGGRVNNVLTNEGGAGAFVADRGTLTVGADVVFEDNETVAGGGAVFVADGGTAEISDNAKLQNNAAKLGGGIYADTQTHDYGGLSISGEVTGNDASENGSGMYVCADANASVQGNVTISGNTHGKNESNVYLPDGATLDIAGATAGANIGVSCDPEEAYRLVSLPDSYAIQPTVNGDEKGWRDDCGTWDVRYMVYQGQPGLYLYYKTLDMTFEDVRTLTGVQGKDISGENTDFLKEKDSMPNISETDGLLAVADTVAKNTPEDDDLVITITADKNDYRIPTVDIVTVTSGGNDVPFSYAPDFEHGTATITVDDAVVDTLNHTIEFGVSAEKYFDLTVRMEGPLYTLVSTITNHRENALVVSETSKVDTEASYKLTSGGNPVAGVEISLYEEGTDALAGAKTTGADGVASFTGLNPTSSYYPILCYERVYRVISRDKVDLALSTLSGQNLAADCIKDAGAETGTVSYDAQAKTASVTGITQNAKVTFPVEQAKDTITFNGNEGDATTAPATLSMASKEMPAGATTYGNLATAALTGYTFDGWYTEAEGGTLVESNTPYATGVSARMLYAHWTANDDTAYRIQHWVEYADGGANARYEAGVTKTKEDGGVTYYFYDETDYTDGTSDAVKDITGLDLKTMSDPTITWWSRDGFTARFEQDCKVLADGSSAFGIYYDRNTYELVFDPAGAGTATPTETVDDKAVDFGSLVGELPTPVLPGYEFGGWYDENDRLITDTTIYDKTENFNLTAHWNAKTDTKWAIKIAVQDIVRDENDVCHAADYTEYKTVYKADDGSLLTGETDTEKEFAVSDIAALTIEGFKYTGYADAYDRNAANKTANTEKATVYIDPTDASTELDGKYNGSFDGGIVWLYYDRKTATVQYPDPEKPGENLGENGDIIYGGDFTGQLPPDPGKDGHDFDGWVDENGNKITEETPADEYVKGDGTINVTPTWTPRDYRLTYVPGEKAAFVASDGGSGTASPTVNGGYLDSHDVTYDQPMDLMPAASKTGYTFDGWFLEDGTEVKSDTVVTVDNVVIHKDDYSYEDTRPLYAHYTPNTYTLVLHPGASSVTGDQGTVSPARVTVTYDQLISGMPVPQLKGYTFVSWLLDLKNPSTIVKNGDVWETVYTNGSEIPVYATYTPNTYKYTFDLNDTVGSTRAALVDTTIDHTDETFDSVYDGIFAVEAIRPGYTFRGWSLTAGGDVLTADDLVALAQDTTVYAKWEPKQYDVKFIMKGATMPDTFDATTAVRDDAADTWTIKVKFDTAYGTLPVPTKAESKYHGWLAAAHWDAINNEVILDLPSYIDHQDDGGITLTAVMEPWITFDPDGNKFADGTTDPKKELQSEITELPAVSKPDYTFDGWATEKNKDKVLTVDDVKKLDRPTVLKPKFSANITFNANGGKMRDNGLETLPTSLGKIKALPSATRSSYNLSGWYTAAENGTQVTLASLVAANVPTTVYAHWSYAGGGGGGGGGGGSTSHTITVTEDEGAKATPNGKVHVTDGNDKTIKIEAEDGYVVTDVIVDGKSQGKLDKYIFEKVKKDHTLSVKVVKLLTGDHIAYIAGYPDGSVHPEAAITRAEAAMIFYRLLSDEARKEYGTTGNSFPDAAGLWSSAAVGTLANAGIVTGYKDGTFRPDAAITRAEFAAIASRFDKLDGGSAVFSDVTSDHWAYRYIVSAAAKGWVNGYSDGTFHPDQSITRAEVVKIVNAVLMRTADRDFITKNSNAIRMFADLSAMHWAYYEIMEAAHAHDYESTENTEVWISLK